MSLKTLPMAVLLAGGLMGIAAPVHSEGAAAARSAAAAEAATAVVIQVSDDDPKKWNLALNNAQNVQQDLGKDKAKIEIVAYGPGLGMLKLDSPVASRVADALGDGVTVVACENTMRKQKLGKADMLPDIGYVKSGVPEIMSKQAQGYSYIRP